MGTVVAFKEQTPPVQNTPTNKKELIDELSFLSTLLDVQNRLSAFGMALQVLEEPSVENAAYYLLEISPAEPRVVVVGFKFSEFQEAAAKYLEAEKNIPVTGGKDAVLVSVKSVAALKIAYPNYFADTRVFANLIREPSKNLPCFSPIAVHRPSLLGYYVRHPPWRASRRRFCWIPKRAKSRNTGRARSDRLQVAP
jgi:hypothetical protein